MSESGIHGLFQHRKGYYFTVLQEDYCEIFKGEDKNEVCRAYITSILEHLTNKHFEETGNDEDIWVYMSLPQMAYRMRYACSERTIHKELKGMIEDGYLEKRRSEGNATMEYKLNVKKINQELAALPDRQSGKSATSNPAKLQERCCKSATSNPANLQEHTLQNCKVVLADLQPRITKEIPENKQEEKQEREKALPLSSDSPASLSSSFESSPHAKEESPPVSTYNEETLYETFCQLQGFRPRLKEQLAKERKLAAEIAQTTSQEEFMTAYRRMKDDPYWATKQFSFATFAKHLAEYLHAPEKQNGKQPRLQGEQTTTMSETTKRNIERLKAAVAQKKG